MSYTPESLKEVISRGLAADEVVVTDLTGTRDHYRALVVASAFEGKSLVQRHQMVYRAIGSDVGGAIHALSLETLTPEQWRQRNSQVAG